MAAKPPCIFPRARVSTCLVFSGTSNIFKHLQNSQQCRTSYFNESFSILDHASTTFQLKIKESILLHWEQPTLNHQLQNFLCNFLLSSHVSFCSYILYCKIVNSILSMLYCQFYTVLAFCAYYIINSVLCNLN